MRSIVPFVLVLTSVPVTAFAQQQQASATPTSSSAPDVPTTASSPPPPAARPSSASVASTPTTVSPDAPAPVAARSTAAPHPGRIAWPPMASWHNDVFYISSPDGSWFIAPTGRLQIDGYVYTGPEVTHDYTTPAGAYRRPDVSNTIMLRRARLETIGGFLGRFTFALGGEFSSGTAPIATDMIFNAAIHPMLNAQLGQFDAPFTMENRTSDKFIDFLERSMAVRAFGAPTNKEIGLMLWGELPSRLFYYSIGVFNGDGQNRLNRDSYFDGIGRVFAHPLILTRGLLQNFQIGASFRVGWRGESVDYQYPSMTTQGGWAFFNTALAGGANPVTMVPDSLQSGVAGEIDLPIQRFDLRGEFIWQRNSTAEMGAPANDPSRLAGPAQRLGTLEGVGYYVQLGYWLFGDTGVNGRPGYENPPALNLGRPDRVIAPFGVQVLARFDAVDVRYDGGSRSDPSHMHSATDGAYTTYAAEFGVNVWWTRHVRFSLNYAQYFFPSRHQGGGAATFDENHAIGPHGGNDSFGELSARVGLAL